MTQDDLTGVLQLRNASYERLLEGVDLGGGFRVLYEPKCNMLVLYRGDRRVAEQERTMQPNETLELDWPITIWGERADYRGFWFELEEILGDGFTGQIVLHCNNGEVTKYELREIRHPVTGLAKMRKGA